MARVSRHHHEVARRHVGDRDRRRLASQRHGVRPSEDAVEILPEAGMIGDRLARDCPRNRVRSLRNDALAVRPARPRHGEARRRSIRDRVLLAGAPHPFGVQTDHRVRALLKVGIADVDRGHRRHVGVRRFAQHVAAKRAHRRPLFGERKTAEPRAERAIRKLSTREPRRHREPRAHVVDRRRRLRIGAREPGIAVERDRRRRLGSRRRGRGRDDGLRHGRRCASGGVRAADGEGR